MDEITQTNDEASNSKADRSTDGFGMRDVVAIVDTVRMADVPVLNAIGAVIIVPIAVIGIFATIWCLARWLWTHLGPWLDYRRYLNGKTW